MGLSAEPQRIQPGGTLVAPAPRGIIDPGTGKPVGATDPYFREISDELATELDPDAALKRLASRVVTTFAEYCVTYATDGRSIRRLGFAHRDPAQLPLVEALTWKPIVCSATCDPKHIGVSDISVGKTGAMPSPKITRPAW